MKFSRCYRTLPLSILATAIIYLVLLCGRGNCAAAATLPSGLGWGMTAEECKGRMLAAGYESRATEIPEASPDRLLRRSALLYGIRDDHFHRRTASATEHVSLRLHNDVLFQVSIRYEDFGRGFRDKVLDEISRHMGTDPRRVPTPNSDMDVYAWSVGVTMAQFGYRELPKLDLYFAEASYRNGPVVTELKRLGLQ